VLSRSDVPDAEGVDGIDPSRVISNFDLHVPDSAQTHNDGLGALDHQVKVISPLTRAPHRFVDILRQSDDSATKYYATTRCAPRTPMPSSSPHNGAEIIAARLMPLQQVVLDKPESVRDVMSELAITGMLGPINYFLGGKINDVDVDSTVLNPAHRRTIWSVFTNSDEARDRLISFIPNNVTGVCFNRHSPSEPDWRNACWGPHYARLEVLKIKYDPNHVFNCWHCPRTDLCLESTLAY
jgi:hypothetical protein